MSRPDWNRVQLLATEKLAHMHRSAAVDDRCTSCAAGTVTCTPPRTGREQDSRDKWYFSRLAEELDGDFAPIRAGSVYEAGLVLLQRHFDARRVHTATSTEEPSLGVAVLFGDVQNEPSEQRVADDVVECVLEQFSQPVSIPDGGATWRF